VRSENVILFIISNLARTKMAKPIPKPSILDEFEYIGAVNGVKRWRSDGGKRIYTWDALHGEVEVFNKRGKHLGVLDPITGTWLKEAVPGRYIDV
jgi:hypothetical protein